MNRSRARSALFAPTIALLATSALSTAVVTPAAAQATANPPATPLVAPPTAGPSGVVRQITVEGNERLEAATVISYLPIAPGDTVDAARIDLALKTLYRTDLFNNVEIGLRDDGTLVVTIVENPIINLVVFEGNRALNDDKLRDEINIHP